MNEKQKEQIVKFIYNLCLDFMAIKLLIVERLNPPLKYWKYLACLYSCQS